MNCVITDEEAAIRRLEARYEADPTIFDDSSMAPLGQPSEESIRNSFAMLRTLATTRLTLDDVKWLEDGRIYTETEDGRKALRLATHTWHPDILATMRRLLLEELEKQANADRHLAHLIGQHRSVKG